MEAVIQQDGHVDVDGKVFETEEPAQVNLTIVDGGDELPQVEDAASAEAPEKNEVTVWAPIVVTPDQHRDLKQYARDLGLTPRQVVGNEAAANLWPKLWADILETKPERDAVRAEKAALASVPKTEEEREALQAKLEAEARRVNAKLEALRASLTSDEGQATPPGNEPDLNEAGGTDQGVGGTDDPEPTDGEPEAGGGSRKKGGRKKGK